MYVGFAGDLATDGQGQAWFGTPDVVGILRWMTAGQPNKPLMPCDPQRGGTRPGETIFDVSCIEIPEHPDHGPLTWLSGG